jgi:hypothetical protein
MVAGMSIRRAVFMGVLLVGACRPATPTTTPGAATAEADPRDVTRPGDPPPMYRPGSDGPLVAITSNAYGRYRYAPQAPQMADTLPDFELPVARGGRWSLKAARAKGPVVIVFYRGFW